MSVILIMLPAALFLAACAVGAFIWATRRGQFEDLDTPPVRAVFDDEPHAALVPPSTGTRRPDPTP